MALDPDQNISRITGAETMAELETIRVGLLGRNGELTARLRSLGTLPQSQRAGEGAALNALRVRYEAAIVDREQVLRKRTFEQAVSGILDVTAPGILPVMGHRHPVSIVLDELTDLFWQMGYQVADGPEIETPWHIFEALNIPEDHPARDMQDTFYLENGLVPRTHTSGIQIRHMLEHKDSLPIRIIAPGKVYRNEDEDSRHSWSFYQIEGLARGRAMLKGVLGKDTAIRLRSNYFPYTEPSVEMDATCIVCAGSGVHQDVSCHLCGGTGWLELGGAGMVHPQVLRNVGIDPDIYSGFAFGFGPERIAAIKFNVDDVREFWRPNFKFLEQF